MRKSIEPVFALLLVVVEHTKVRVKEFFSQQLEELLSDTSLIYSLFSNELHLQLFIEFQVTVVEKLECVIHNVISVNLKHKIWTHILEIILVAIIDHVHDVNIHKAILHFLLLYILAAIAHYLTFIRGV